jgi:hypothetical protein
MGQIEARESSDEVAGFGLTARWGRKLVIPHKSAGDPSLREDACPERSEGMTARDYVILSAAKDLERAFVQQT